MEGVFFVLIAAALFSHSWHLLGLYHEGRTVGLYTAGLGLVSLIALTLAPMVLSASGSAASAGASDILAGTTMMKVLIILWAGYAVGVGAQGLWEFDERAIGFYSGFLTAASAVAFVFFGIELEDRGVGLTSRQYAKLCEIAGTRIPLLRKRVYKLHPEHNQAAVNYLMKPGEVITWTFDEWLKAEQGKLSLADGSGPPKRSLL